MSAEPQREFDFSQKDFDMLRGLVSEKSGIVLADHKQNMVYSRLARRLRALKLTSFQEYRELLQGPEGEAEVGDFVNAITTNLTRFFRESHHFDHLRDEVLRSRLKQGGERRLRLWSSASSSGMEPYSMAMTLRDALGAELSQWDALILATDIDTNMLNHGKKGHYDVREWENIPANYRQDYCRKEMIAGKEMIAMKPELQRLIRFNHLNLLKEWPMRGKFDAIFCRNVVIYFDKETQRVLFDRMADILVPGGWLYIGHSESMHNICDRFELRGRTIYQKIR